jgi:hypothetical protein
MLHFRAFDPPTLETFAEHTRREVYRELRRAVADLRTKPHDSYERYLGIAYARVTVLYDIGHPRAFNAMQRYERTRDLIRRTLATVKDPYVCQVCGSEDIEFQAHIRPNENDRITWRADDGDCVWCHACQRWGGGAARKSEFPQQQSPHPEDRKASRAEKAI